MKKFGIITLVITCIITAGVMTLRAFSGGEDGMKAAEMKLTGLKNGIAVECGDTIGEIYVSVPDAAHAEDIISVSSDPDIAYLKLYDDPVGQRVLKAEVVAVSTGIAEIYVRSGDGTVSSDKYEINVIAGENDEEITTVESGIVSDNIDGTAVYVTPSGTKYHLSSSCAGGNCTAVELSEAVEQGYQPCKNCAMK